MGDIEWPSDDLNPPLFTDVVLKVLTLADDLNIGLYRLR